MAIVKVNYTQQKGAAKANIRYIEHRPGKDGAKITRQLFGSDGLMGRYEAYRMIDEAKQGSRFFRIILNPDAQTEDTKRDLNLREVAQRTIHSIEEQLHTPITWVASLHDDHTPLRHIHMVAIVNETLLPVQAMRREATEACIEQRKERDLVQEQQVQGRKEAQWEREH